MKLSTREDIEAPVDYVFEHFTKFQVFETRARRAGADVKRLTDGNVKTGTEWDVAFTYRGRHRKFRSVLTEFDDLTRICAETRSEGIEATVSVDFVALSRKRTRAIVQLEFRARTLSARLLIQSVKLAKAKLTKRFKARIVEFAEDIEDSYRKSA